MYDSDSMVIFNDETMLKYAKNIYNNEKYRVCLNGIGSTPNKYKINNTNMAKIDNSLSLSVKNIGNVTNTSSWILATYWEKLAENKGVATVETDALLKKIDICSILQGVCIDLAKKSFNIDLKVEIENLTKGINLSKEIVIDGKTKIDKRKPSFFKYVSESKTIKNKVRKYDCGMDILETIISEISDAEGVPNVNFDDLLEKRELNPTTVLSKKDVIDRKQRSKVEVYAEELNNIIDSIHSKYQNKNDEESMKEKNRMLDDTYGNYNVLIGRLKINKDTLYSMLMKGSSFSVNKNLLNLMFKTQRDTFMKCFKVNK